MVILGIDPGIANTGFGVVRRGEGRVVALDGGVIQTAGTQTPEQRLAILHEQVGALLDRHTPDAVALEALYFGQNARDRKSVV